MRAQQTNPFRFFTAGIAILFATIMTNHPAASAATPVSGFEKQSDGLLLNTQPGNLRLQVWADGVIRVTYTVRAQLPELSSFTIIGKPAKTEWAVRETSGTILLETKLLRARVDRKTGAVAIFTVDGQPLIAETDGGREMLAAPPTTQPEHAIPGPVQQSFALQPDEAIFGLGQHQQGQWDYRGHIVRLLQRNMEVGIPVMLSSKGYLLLWDNPAVTDVAVGAAAPATGAAAAAGPDSPPVGAGKDVLRWSSETGKAIDYYVFYGSTPDASMQQYRELSGQAPMMPRWLWGFWQCKERYRTNDELMEVAQKYREMKVPIDGIIQDWRYWPDDTWGSHTFDKARYPDPAATFRRLHDLNYHVLISVWPKFDLGTANIDELQKAGAMFDPVIPYVFPPGRGKWYDPFSQRGREIYWKQISAQLFSLGIDGWWLDAPEPELSGKWGEFRNFRTADGPGATVFNAYPLMHSTGIYQGQRAQTDEKRVVILTRSAYAGQQRNSAITWSGDIGSSWSVLRRQVPAGLNFSASGIPYWNTDIGGFGGVRNPSDPRYGEIFARWFEFGSFCPMFRVHGSAPDGGTGPGKEIWRFDQRVQEIWKTYDNLRYRLMPYIYSVSWQVTNNGSTMMRPLVMDFVTDPKAVSIGDQYLFGPAIMVNPVTTQGATTRSVYLPATTAASAQSTGWYDFWTGKSQAAGQTLDAAAPLETMPLFVRAGSIIPMGPFMQYTGEKPADPIELRVYPGADGAFTLYEDEGDSYRYERGVYSTIPISWDDKSQTLTIGGRKGSFPGMLQDRTFHIVVVRENHGNGVELTASPDAVVKYTGQSITATPPRFTP